MLQSGETMTGGEADAGPSSSVLRAPNSEFRAPHSALRAFLSLVALTARRHWRVRSLGWVTLGLLALMTAVVAVITHGPVGWRLESRPVWVAAMKDDLKDDQRAD